MEKNNNFFRIAENGHEEKQHGTIDYPCALYYNDTGAYVPWHWHDEYEITYVNSGRLCCYVGDKKIILENGQAVFINSQILHHSHTVRDSECLHSDFVFHGRLVYGSEESILWKKYLQPITASSRLDLLVFSGEEHWHKRAIELIEKAIYLDINKNDGYEFGIRECFTEIMLLIYENCRADWEKEARSNQNETDRMKCMLKFIHEHFDEQITLAQIADSANICERECTRSFQRFVRCSPVQYLIRYRIMRSCSMLSENKYTITRICSDCGFTSPSYFAKIFKREAGCTPREYARGKHKFEHENGITLD